MLLNLFNTLEPKESFWKWFSKNEDRIFRDIDSEDDGDLLYEEIISKLHRIDENLTFDTSPILSNNKKELYLSADGVGDSFHFVKELVEEAPTLNKWDVKAFRQRVSEDNYTVSFDDYTLSYSDVFFNSIIENDELGIQLYIRNYDDTIEMEHAVYLLLDGLLGEYDVATCIDAIDWYALKDADTDSLQPIVELRAIVDQRK